MAEAIQVVKAADNGIKAITSLINSAKGLASSAQGTSDTNAQQAYYDQYLTIQSQITKLTADSGYRGTNLLNGDTLSIEFSAKAGTTLDIVGGTATTATGLGLDAVNTTWATGTATVAAADSALMDTALTSLRSKSSTLASNLSIVTARQDFTNNMISTLQTGADGLTLADMNQEGANMLMLQTRQSLGTTALSLSSQAAQSVLRLF
jgi:flagellin-like hook-associated protein FlgL